MLKRFIVIKCETLGDQWECDADRQIQPILYTEDEVKTLFHEKKYINAITGEEFETAKECKADALSEYGGDLESFLYDNNYDTEEEAWSEQCQEVYDNAIEVYEIDGVNLIFRKDLSTYEG